MSETKSNALSLYIWKEHDPPYTLHQSLFVTEKCLSIFRFIIIFFFLSIIIWMLSDMSWKYFLFVTNWGFSVSFCFFLLATLENFLVKNSHPFLWKLTHVIFEIAITVEFSIVLFYWTALFYLDYDKHKDDNDFSAWLFNDVCIHFLGFLFLWLDNIFNQIKFFKEHFLFVIIFQLCYLAVNCPYTLMVDNIYPPINWVDIWSYLCCLVVIILLIIHHFLAIWFFEKVKKGKIEKKNEFNMKSEKISLL